MTKTKARPPHVEAAIKAGDTALLSVFGKASGRSRREKATARRLAEAEYRQAWADFLADPAREAECRERDKAANLHTHPVNE